MQFYYGHQMPLRVLDEAEFWKHQEEEHTVVIRELVKDLEQQYVDALKEWEKAFAQTHQQVVRYIETVNRSQGQVSPALFQDILQLTSFCLQQSDQFIQFCRTLMQESQPISANPTAKVVLNHIIVESEYFIGIAQTILYQQKYWILTSGKWSLEKGHLPYSIFRSLHPKNINYSEFSLCI